VFIAFNRVREKRTYNILPRREGKMRKLFIAFAFVLLLNPVMSFAQTNHDAIMLKSLQEKVLAVNPEAVTTYWVVTFSYQASVSGWWTGLAVRNGANPNTFIAVSLFDNNGVIVGQGSFTIGPDLGLHVAALNGLITSGHVPPTGAVFISGTNYFTASMFVGNDSGGFSMIEKIASVL
jgi:hypothetical protein